MGRKIWGELIFWKTTCILFTILGTFSPNSLAFGRVDQFPKRILPLKAPDKCSGNESAAEKCYVSTENKDKVNLSKKENFVSRWDSFRINQILNIVWTHCKVRSHSPCSFLEGGSLTQVQNKNVQAHLLFAAKLTETLLDLVGRLEVGCCHTFLKLHGFQNRTIRNSP